MEVRLRDILHLKCLDVERYGTHCQALKSGVDGDGYGKNRVRTLSGVQAAASVVQSDILNMMLAQLS